MSNVPEFKEWPKIARLNRECIITEKIDGTNGCVIVTEDGVWAQSRNRVMAQDTDPFGFALWVEQNKDALRSTLGPGYHYGEWCGRGIQRGYGLQERMFALFNVSRWNGVPLPDGVTVVPTLYRGLFSTTVVENNIAMLRQHGSQFAPGFMRPEGIVVYHCAAEVGFKVTLERDEKRKGGTR
jgi:RNA ligase